MEIDKIYNMDCLEGMKQIPDGLIDAIITDPPYEFKDTTGGGLSVHAEERAQARRAEPIMLNSLRYPKA